LDDSFSPPLDLGERIGHAFWIGGTTHLLLSGVELLVVMAIGCWSSYALLGYWRNCDEILAMFISFSMDSFQSTITTMSNFKAMLAA